jgi:hypothetical protein
MDSETQTRFERIEADLAGAGSILRTVAEIQQRQGQAMDSLTEALSSLTDRISAYVDGADARMRRIEENLDGLIRAITAEHGNGKKN